MNLFFVELTIVLIFYLFLCLFFNYIHIHVFKQLFIIEHKASCYFLILDHLVAFFYASVIANSIAVD